MHLAFYVTCGEKLRERPTTFGNCCAVRLNLVFLKCYVQEIYLPYRLSVWICKIKIEHANMFLYLFDFYFATWRKTP